MSHLFSPLQLRSVTARNRLWVSPMCQYSATDGIPNEWHHTHLTSFATGGAGLVMAEASAVVPEGRISPDDTGLWNDEQRDAWAPIVRSIQARGALAGIQLSHAGRKASTASPLHVNQRGSVSPENGGWQSVAPSALAYQGLAEPVAMSISDIDSVVEAFLAATQRAVQAGFDVVEIHAAHGYLLHQFLSPLSNTREDDHGGPLQNRARLLIRIVEAVRDAHPELPIFVRFSASDWAEGGWNEVETASVASRLAAAGAADLFDVSSGGLVADQKISVGPGYQVPHASFVRRETDALVSAVGMITSGIQAETILAAGDADAIMAGREWLRDPHFALRASEELGVTLDYWPAQYARARQRS